MSRVRESALEKAPRRRVLVLGDSISAERLSWARLLARAAALCGSATRIENRAVSGATSDDVRAIAARSDLDNVDLALVLVGTNDAFARRAHPDRPILSDANTTLNLERIAAALTVETWWLTPSVIRQAMSTRTRGVSPKG